MKTKKHEYAIKRLEGIAISTKDALKMFPAYTLVSTWKKNLKDVKEAIEVLKKDAKNDS